MGEFQNILSKLSDPQHRWWTLPELANATGLPMESVLRAISEHGDKIAETQSKTGQPLYITRSRLTLGEQFLGALKNRAV